MKPKRLLLSSTVAFAIAMSGAATPTSHANTGSTQARDAKLPTSAPTVDLCSVPKEQRLLHVLGVTEDELYEALQHGKSLAELASSREVDVLQVIKLQVSELTEQLDARLAQGSLSSSQYEAQKSELVEIVANSVFGTP